jgi:hypothetical protein
VIDYSVVVDSIGDGSFMERQSSITDTFVTLTGFTLGQNYIFKVKARNSFGFGDYSLPVTILSAKTPE